MNVPREGKTVARFFLHQAGGLQVVRFWNRRDFRILMYHDFPSVPGLEKALARQCAHIQRYYHVVSLTQIARFLREGTALPPNALAVTVDDGNRDFLLHGYPVFQAHRIPVTVFLVSGFLDRKLWLWWDQISYMVEQSRRSAFHLALQPDQPAVSFKLETAEQREQAGATITRAMKRLNPKDRERMLRETLTQALGVKIPVEPPLHMAPMEWSEVRQLAQDGIDFGAHTVTHPVLSQLQDSQELLREIGDSKRRIEEELQRPILHFCYPFGQWDDFNDQTLKVLGQCQFQTAVTSEKGMNSKNSHPLKLTRFGIEPMMAHAYFQEWLTGLHTA